MLLEEKQIPYNVKKANGHPRFGRRAADDVILPSAK